MEAIVNNETYVIGKMRMKQQRNVLKRILPVVTALEVSAEQLSSELKADSADSFAKAIGPIAKAIGSMSDEDTDYIFDACFAEIKRKTAGGWQGITASGELRFEDILLPHQFQLLFYALKENYADFLAALPGQSSAGGSAGA